ncbi:MAG: zinc ribbon domain-containing protein [Candidatus Omnitrophota bacterium]|nr:zinc-ribbon domain-containing protein [Candidatus Omnitrophota bacterium]
MPEYICPHCKNPIYDDEATLCLYCGESLDRAIGFMGRIKYSRPKVIAITVTLAAILSFLLFVLR